MASLAIAPDIFSLNKYISTVLAIPSIITLHFRALLQLLLPGSWIIHRQHLHFLVSQNLNSLFLSPQFFVLFCLDIYSSAFFYSCLIYETCYKIASAKEGILVWRVSNCINLCNVWRKDGCPERNLEKMPRPAILRIELVCVRQNAICSNKGAVYLNLISVWRFNKCIINRVRTWLISSSGIGSMVWVPPCESAIQSRSLLIERLFTTYLTPPSLSKIEYCLLP